MADFDPTLKPQSKEVLTEQEKKDRHRECMRAWRAANAEQLKAQGKAYYEANKEKCLAGQKARRKENCEAANAQARARYARNKEAIQSRRKAHYLENIETYRAKSKVYCTANKEQKRAVSRNSRHGITQSDFDGMVASQNDRCLICKTLFGFTKKSQPHVDHCHRTGRIRGLLCGPCNLMLGLAKDNPKILKAAIAYLKPPRIIPESDPPSL